MTRPRVCPHGWLVGGNRHTCTICPQPDALPSRVPCHNRRHRHDLAVGARCLPIVPQDRPLPDRVVGTTAVLAVTGIGVAFCVGWAAGEWLATEGRVRLELARQRAREAWCRGLG